MPASAATFHPEALQTAGFDAFQNNNVAFMQGGIPQQNNYLGGQQPNPIYQQSQGDPIQLPFNQVNG